MFPRISETFILEEIQALRRHGVPVKIYSLLAPVRDARVHPEARDLASECSVLAEARWSHMPRFLTELWSCFRVRPSGTAKQVFRLLREPGSRSFRRLVRATDLAVRMRRDHVAHLHAAWAHGPSSVARIACRLTGIPWSMGAHAKDIHLSRASSLRKKLSSARFSLACSAASQDLLRRLAVPRPGALPESEITLLHHGVDAVYFMPGTQVEESTLIVSVGRLVAKKGFDVLLEAARVLRERGIAFRVEILGDGPERGRLETMIRDLDLESVVRIRGLCVRDEVREALRRAACFTLACRTAGDGDRDGIPNSIAEAMACGLPVVSTRLPGIEELVRDGETGLLVTPEDPSALAEALARILGERDFRRKLGARARESVSRHFDAVEAGKRRARRFAQALGIEKVLYLSADRGVPVRGDKGASVHVRSVVAALRDLGVETCVLTRRAGPAEGPKPAAPVLEATSGKNWKAIAQRIARWSRGGEALERAVLRLVDNAKLYGEGRQLVEGWRPDLIYERYALTSFAGAWLADYLRVPLVVEVNSPLADEEARFRGLRLGWLARWMERRIVRRADYVVAVSEGVRQHVLRLGAPPERILLLPNAVDPRLFHPARDGKEVRRAYDLEGQLVAGFCGSLKTWHGVDRLLDATALVSSELPKLSLLVVGDGPERHALERQARALGIEDRVRFAGAVPHAQVPDHLAACDVLVAPYEPTERFYFSPLKLAEYLRTGRAVVATAIPGLKEAFDPDTPVTWISPGDTGALVDALMAHGKPSAVPAARREVRPTRVWTWTDVAQRVLEAGEVGRRRLWAWKKDPGPVAPLSGRFR
jgi:glycosyltransferase involved in cell wall biosynthesis